MPSPCETHPDPNVLHPVPGHKRVVLLKAVVDQPNIEVGDFSYYDDPEAPEKFVERCVLYHFPFMGDRLVIGRFVAIATGVRFVMNGANHAMDGFSTFPFAIFGGSWAEGLSMDELQDGSRGDTVIGHDVWLGMDATIMPGIRVGNGAVVAAKSVVTRDVPPFAVVAGNPARIVRTRFEPAVVDALLDIAWWNWTPERITNHLSAIRGADLDALRRALDNTEGTR
ncbi:CatB-related O-acetyltransferase [Chthonobacter albigriseus]|uniref:CatB-related O-acetyltransferase n=1 Tax=Chthonobacter albigriseus TaxID=1683161 RepID=UPI0015EEE9E0|nr:CatB-related O-acetyltransferase [Chthonobacter albigriseus]